LTHLTIWSITPVIIIIFIVWLSNIFKTYFWFVKFVYLSGTQHEWSIFNFSFFLHFLVYIFERFSPYSDDWISHLRARCNIVQAELIGWWNQSCLLTKILILIFQCFLCWNYFLILILWHIHVKSLNRLNILLEINQSPLFIWIEIILILHVLL